MPSHGRHIALTIDDGPALPWTAELLAVLERHSVVATYCLVGSNAAAHPDWVRRIADHGHALANHTWGHPNLAHASAARVRSEIDRAQTVIADAARRAPTFFRAPYGAWSRTITDACTEHHLRPLGWSVDPRDWARPSVPTLVSRLLGDIRPGSIVVAHDGGGDRSNTVGALSVVLPRLLDAGYTFVTP